jgi:penicillin-binding protein 1C
MNLKKPKSTKGWKIFLSFLQTILIIFLAGLVLAVALFLYYTHDFPRPDKFTHDSAPQPTRIYDSRGEILLYNVFGEENRLIVPLEKISIYAQKAVIALEDARFYQHHGVDFKGIIRAILIDLKLRRPAAGASTISQQLIRSHFLSTERTAERKIREVLLTLELERQYSKDEILEWYLNQVPFGSNFYGIESASQGFFNKTSEQLTIGEAATLAAIIQAPSALSPYGDNQEALIARQKYALQRMVYLEFIDQESFEEALVEEIDFAEIIHSLKAPHFTIKVLEELENMYGRERLERDGLKIYTTLDWEMQSRAEEIVRERVADYQIFRIYNGSLVAIDPQSGAILAMVGSKNYFDESYPEGCQENCLFQSQFNVATSGARHPGSALKPFIYAVALQKGATPEDIIEDEPTNFGLWGGSYYIPQNYDGLFRGSVTLRSALAQSLNIPAVKVFMYLAGIEDSIKLLEQAGISDSLPAVPSLVLGGGGVRLVELTASYGIFANEGLKVNPYMIDRVENAEGKIIFENKNSIGPRIIDRSVAQDINSILSDNEARSPMFGRNSNLYLEQYPDVSVKTGTNQDYKDFWTIGYNKDIVVGVWLGNNNQAPMVQRPSVSTAGAIWKEFMIEALNRIYGL